MMNQESFVKNCCKFHALSTHPDVHLAYVSERRVLERADYCRERTFQIFPVKKKTTVKLCGSLGLGHSLCSYAAEKQLRVQYVHG